MYAVLEIPCPPSTRRWWYRYIDVLRINLFRLLYLNQTMHSELVDLDICIIAFTSSLDLWYLPIPELARDFNYRTGCRNFKGISQIHILYRCIHLSAAPWNEYWISGHPIFKWIWQHCISNYLATWPYLCLGNGRSTKWLTFSFIYLSILSILVYWILLPPYWPSSVLLHQPGWGRTLWSQMLIRHRSGLEHHSFLVYESHFFVYSGTNSFIYDLEIHLPSWDNSLP
jgi:hypothetical protein